MLLSPMSFLTPIKIQLIKLNFTIIAALTWSLFYLSISCSALISVVTGADILNLGPR